MLANPLVGIAVRLMFVRQFAMLVGQGLSPRIGRGVVLNPGVRLSGHLVCRSSSPSASAAPAAHASSSASHAATVSHSAAASLTLAHALAAAHSTTLTATPAATASLPNGQVLAHALGRASGCGYWRLGLHRYVLRLRRRRRRL